MKTRMFFGGMLLLLLVEFVALALFALPGEENLQDTVAVNEAVNTVQQDWDSLEDHINSTSLDYVVLDADGTVLYKTKPGLRESMNEAIRHKDTILDLTIDGEIVGKLLIANDDAKVYQAEKQRVVAVIAVVMALQLCICLGYFLYLRHAIIKPFQQMKGFAERVAAGNLDIPLQMDRQNLFGAFTESFDLMRAELKKARLAEARANASKKELVAKLSHDIKTPVASIKAAAEVGAARAADERSREDYGRIVQKADQINTLMTNLFSATLEELQELSVTPAALQSAEVHALLENADYLHRAEIPPIPDCMVVADRLRLQQVFDNLFANSYKYAGTPIRVTARVEDNDLAVCIEDSGGGVDAGELPLLKEKFRRGSNAEGIEGAGLGLYIADYCMKKMEGRLELENGPAGLRAIVRLALNREI